MSEWKLDRASAYIPDVVPESDLAIPLAGGARLPSSWST